MGTLYELIDVLDHMHGGGIAGHVGRKSKAWRKLDEMRLRWRRDPVLKQIRHQLAHHLGDHDEIKRGLEAYKAGRTAIVFDAEKEGKRFDTCAPFATQIILSGLEMDDDGFMGAVERAIDDQHHFASAIQEVLADLLRSLGAQIPTLPEEPEGA